MNVGHKIVDGAIHLIDKDLKELKGQQLSLFLNLLKYSKKRGPYRFSYVSKNSNLLEKSSLRENLLIDSSLISLRTNREDELKNYLVKCENVDLLRLFNKCVSDQKAAIAETESSKKSISLLSSLIRPSDYIFLDHPEVGIDVETLDLYERALLKIYHEEKKTIIIASDDIKRWSAFQHIVVSQNRKTKNYHFRESEALAKIISIPSANLEKINLTSLRKAA